MVHEFGQELPRHVGFKQPIAVLREHGRHPHRIIHAESDEPAIDEGRNRVARSTAVPNGSYRRPETKGLAAAAQARSMAAHYPRRLWQDHRRAPPRSRSQHHGQDAMDVSQPSAAQGPFRKTSRPTTRPSLASLPPAIYQVTNHIRNLSGCVFSSPLASLVDRILRGKPVPFFRNMLWQAAENSMSMIAAQQPNLSARPLNHCCVW